MIYYDATLAERVQLIADQFGVEATLSDEVTDAAEVTVIVGSDVVG